MDNEVSLTSLCFIFENYQQKRRLRRIADVENGLLVPPYNSDRPTKYYENRDWLHRIGKPDLLGLVGIWAWTATPDRSDPEKDHIESNYLSDVSPVRVVVLKANSIENVVEQLKSGTISTQGYICDTFFCYEPVWGKLNGVICHQNDFSITNDEFALLHEDIFALPYYSFSVSDVYNWDERNLRFLRSLQIGAPEEFVQVCNADEIIQAMILERSTWPLFKQSVGATKAEWKNCKTLLEHACSESLYEALADRLKCAPEEAKEKVDSFIARTSARIDAGDVDADVLARIAIQNDELRAVCETELEGRWRAAHSSQMAEAKKELDDIQQKVSAAKAERAQIASDVSNARDELNQLRDDIQRNKSLGEDTVAAVREKISAARSDVAGFLAELTVFTPEQTGMQSAHPSTWIYTGAKPVEYPEDHIDLLEKWEDEFDSICQNLFSALRIDHALCEMLTAFLYSAHIHKIPLLFAGPGGSDISEIFSVSAYEMSAGKLVLNGDYDPNIAEAVQHYPEQILSVQNMFGSGWSDELPQVLSKTNKHVFWTHPYVEDLLIEPKGLFNYMLPVLTEAFVGSFEKFDLFPGKRADHFKPFVSKGEQTLCISALKKLGLSKLQLNRLSLVLSDAKAILNMHAKEKDLEILFGLLPFCVLSGRTEVLKEVLENEKGISNEVRNEAARYFDEE